MPLGVDAALRHLREKGCKLVTKEWVDNHWGFILWKLASLVCACPSLFEEKWNYDEVIRQLLYRYVPYHTLAKSYLTLFCRYERELNLAERPPIRLITEGDTSAARPMVLCIASVTPGEDSVDENGEVVEGLPTLDVTDGWYKVRATVDVPMARAVKRGLLKIGTKIAVSGARVSLPGTRLLRWSESHFLQLQGGKDGMEPLAAYTKVHLELHGNSSTLARWDAKLGFRPTPFIATLRSLSGDGGPVMLMDIVVTKLFPIGYIEMREDGERASPMCEAEERQAADAWKVSFRHLQL